MASDGRLVWNNVSGPSASAQLDAIGKMTNPVNGAVAGWTNARKIFDPFIQAQNLNLQEEAASLIAAGNDPGEVRRNLLSRMSVTTEGPTFNEKTFGDILSGAQARALDSITRAANQLTMERHNNGQVMRRQIGALSPEQLQEVYGDRNSDQSLALISQLTRMGYSPVQIDALLNKIAPEKKMYSDEFNAKTGGRLVSKSSVAPLGTTASQAQATPGVAPVDSPVRGIRNNNPLNLRISNNPWEGKIAGADRDFETFKSVPHAIRAYTKNLQAYDKRGQNTVEKIISTWAPKGDGNNDPVRYANEVASRMGVDKTAKLDLKDPGTLASLFTAMAQTESPGATFSKEDLGIGIEAGLGGTPIENSPVRAFTQNVQQTAQQPAPAPAKPNPAPAVETAGKAPFVAPGTINPDTGAPFTQDELALINGKSNVQPARLAPAQVAPKQQQQLQSSATQAGNYLSSNLKKALKDTDTALGQLGYDGKSTEKLTYALNTMQKNIDDVLTAETSKFASLARKTAPAVRLKLNDMLLAIEPSLADPKATSPSTSLDNLKKVAKDKGANTTTIESAINGARDELYELLKPTKEGEVEFPRELIDLVLADMLVQWGKTDWFRSISTEPFAWGRSIAKKQIATHKDAYKTVAKLYSEFAPKLRSIKAAQAKFASKKDSVIANHSMLHGSLTDGWAPFKNAAYNPTLEKTIRDDTKDLHDTWAGVFNTKSPN